MAIIHESGNYSGPIIKLFISIVWEMFNLTKDRSIRFKAGPIPVSVKVEKLRPLIELWAGPEPTKS